MKANIDEGVAKYSSEAVASDSKSELPQKKKPTLTIVK